MCIPCPAGNELAKGGNGMLNVLRKRRVKRILALITESY
jgi:hypothetical protein